jgi:hypothetical protein
MGRPHHGRQQHHRRDAHGNQLRRPLRLQPRPRRDPVSQPRHRPPEVPDAHWAILTVFGISVALSTILGFSWGTSLIFSFLAAAFTFAWIFMLAFANVALPIFYRRKHTHEFSVAKHVVIPLLGTVLLIPALVSPLLPPVPCRLAAWRWLQCVVAGARGS